METTKPTSTKIEKIVFAVARIVVALLAIVSFINTFISTVKVLFTFADDYMPSPSAGYFGESGFWMTPMAQLASAGINLAVFVVCSAVLALLAIERNTRIENIKSKMAQDPESTPSES